MHSYCGSSPRRSEKRPEISSALNLFALRERHSVNDLWADYMEWDAWQKACKDLGPDLPHPAPPNTEAGDEYWAATFHSAPPPPRTPVHRPDLRDIALRTIRERAPQLTLDLLLSRQGGPVVNGIRAEIVTNATRAGYRGSVIGRFLCISDAAVSRIRTRLRDHSLSDSPAPVPAVAMSG